MTNANVMYSYTRYNNKYTITKENKINRHRGIKERLQMFLGIQGVHNYVIWDVDQSASFLVEVDD